MRFTWESTRAALMAVDYEYHDPPDVFIMEELSWFFFEELWLPNQ